MKHTITCTCVNGHTYNYTKWISRTTLHQPRLDKLTYLFTCPICDVLVKHVQNWDGDLECRQKS